MELNSNSELVLEAVDKKQGDMLVSLLDCNVMVMGIVTQDQGLHLPISLGVFGLLTSSKK